MFDHLETKTIRPLETHHHITLWVLVTSCLMLLLTFYLPLSFLWQDSDTVSAAAPIVRIWPDSQMTQPRTVVGPVSDMELATFVMQVEETEVDLKGLALTIDGLYAPADLSTARMYLDEVQVGHDVELSTDGRYVFRFDILTVPVGTHTISIRADWFSRAADRTLVASIATVGDLMIQAGGEQIKVSSVFPQAMGQITFADKGSLRWMAQDLPSQEIGNDQKPVVVFLPLTVQAVGEIVDVRRVVWSYEVTNMRPQEIQFLVAGAPLQTWQSSAVSDSLELVIPDGILLLGSQIPAKTGWQVSLLPQRSGAELKLTDISLSGIGYTSGQEIQLMAETDYRRYVVNEQPSFSLADSSLSDRYSMRLQTLSDQSIEIDNIYLMTQSDYPLTLDWVVEVNGESVPRTISPSGSNSLRFLFKDKLELKTGDTLSFKPEVTPSESTGDIEVVLQTDTLQWNSDSRQWFAVAKPGIPAAGAFRIIVP